MYTVAMFIVLVLQTFLLQHYYTVFYSIAMCMKTAVIGAVYKKVSKVKMGFNSTFLRADLDIKIATR